ncbi:DUF397 domain-containing protein [Streptomyces sp. NPDC048106]|uniref:DUF397 domain-containing protein n=1 Tax=Streptomyces sp. NPDC048106 TaxID=3155750 RepID=UPI00345414CE
MALTALDLAPEGDYSVSSYSGNGNNCVKVANPSPSRSYVAVCDSKHDNGPAFAVSPETWAQFVAFAS